MRIIKKYQFNVAWYALVELDDGSRVELKLRQESQPDDAEFITRGQAYQEAIKPKAKTLIMVSYPVMTVTGRDLTTNTIKQYANYLNGQPALHPLKLGDYIMVSLNACYKIFNLDESDRAGFFNMTVKQFKVYLDDFIIQNPAKENDPVVSVIMLEVANGN